MTWKMAILRLKLFNGLYYLRYLENLLTNILDINQFQVRIELFDDGDEVAEFEFEGVMQNLTSFFNPRNLRKSSYFDIPVDGTPFPGDDFSFDG